MVDQELSLLDPIGRLPGVGPAVARKLQTLGVARIIDLVELLPNRLEDRSNLVPIAQLTVGSETVIKGTLTSLSSRRTKKGQLVVQGSLIDQSGKIPVVWFNQRYLLGQLKIGQQLCLFGAKRLVPSMSNPFFVKKIIFEAEIAPIYPATSGLNQATLRKLFGHVKPLLDQVTPIFPAEINKKFALPARAETLRDCHFPSRTDALIRAQQQLGLEELTILAAQISLTKAKRQQEQGIVTPIDEAFIKNLVEALPFRLTAGQKKATWEIMQDLARPWPMNRLLYGEVGSGKTIVALLVACLVLQAGYTVFWLNPTLSLAIQQYEVAKKLLATTNFKVALVTGHKKEQLLGGELVIGTHALLHLSTSQLKKPVGLVVVDEQHRFGVEQRQKLLSDFPQANLLMMTATPIPRSLAQTIFGYLELSYLTEKPAHQQPIKTVVFAPEQRPDIEQEISQRLGQGQPGYVICPLIEPDNEAELSLFALERKAITTEAKRLQAVFPQARLATLHGKLTNDEKEEIVTKFRSGSIDILLATTVVEVGIDNPAATWILIEEADKFGLATIHQLRGRVGRGDQASVCFLSQTLSTPTAEQRLKALQRNLDGLALAELDLSLRGPGELTGIQQSGLPLLKYASLFDQGLVAQAFAIAKEMIDNNLMDYPPFAARLNQRVNSEATLL